MDCSDNPYKLLFKAASMIPISHYALGLLLFVIVFLYNFLEFHFLEDLRTGFRGSPVSLTYNSCSEIYEGVASKCRILHGRYLATPWLSSPHIQTTFLNFFGKPPIFSYRRQLFHASDGGTIALDWLLNNDVPEDGTHMNNSISKDDTTPIMVVIPGLTSDSASAYIKHLAFNTAKKGWNVVVINHRGLGGVSTTSDCFYNAGWTEDTRDILDYLHGEYVKAPLFAVGTSIGANILVKYLGEDGENVPVAGAVAICSPWDLLIGDRFISRRLVQKLYDRALTIGLQGYAQLHQSRYSRLANWEGIRKGRVDPDRSTGAERRPEPIEPLAVPPLQRKSRGAIPRNRNQPCFYTTHIVLQFLVLPHHLPHRLFRNHHCHFLLSVRRLLVVNRQSILEHLVLRRCPFRAPALFFKQPIRARKSRSIRDYDKYATCLVGKFETVDTYYRRCSSSSFVGNVSVPLLCISALDDPVCTREAIPWDECRANKNIVLATTQHGGHLAFFEGVTGSSIWWVRAVFEFLSILHSSPFMHRQKKTENQCQHSSLESSIDQAPYVHVTDGMVAPMGNELMTNDVVEDFPEVQNSRDKVTEEVALDSKECEPMTQVKPDHLPEDVNSFDITNPIRRCLNQLSRQNKTSMWLLGYIAIISTWPLVGAALHFFKKKIRTVLPAKIQKP
ncbi:hypothetical protein U1Q18_036998 [Sarracenia purpurea var. burkii]